MKIKDYKCKCGHNDFFFADNGNQKGIYCSYCGKWLKWADKGEQNLSMKQEPILEKDGTLIVTTEHYENVRRVLVEYGTNGALFYQDREPTTKNDFDNGRTYGYEEVLEIIDKYKAESEDKE